jgi:hypothetical protein
LEKASQAARSAVAEFVGDRCLLRAGGGGEPADFVAEAAELGSEVLEDSFDAA